MSPGATPKAELKAALVQKAIQLGFDACRVTTAEPPASAPDFERALAEGRHAEMAWLAKAPEKRADLSRVLPGIRSVITLAISYHRPAEQEVSGRAGSEVVGLNRAPSGPASVNPDPEMASPLSPSLSGVVARYAQHPDYHDLLKEPLRALTEFLDTEARVAQRSLWYVDTGPILERDLAQRAGIGFVGKHTNLISRSLGNWFLLAEILTTADLEPDAPEHNRCGSCTRCLSACPTGALPAPFTLDARRCISYLTIEHRGSIPEDLRPAIGTRIFGCDDCLAACPWNRFARAGAILREHHRADLTQPDLLELLSLDEAAFKSRFAGTPLLRTKRRGLLRNVCVALGNVGDPRAIPALTQAAQDPEPLIAEHAAWALRRIESASPAPGIGR
ncbi:MAG: tRNA epoxyqueuosine(34) reductase QueG [Verrucomicrobia bacterium]|nr:tRNA epoxyqueuosine(34) reductase QueG [Verrucomicrobiota bacterium]